MEKEGILVLQAAIIIPARWGSTRLPGKPLVPIAGKLMLERVVRIALRAAEGLNVRVAVATDDDRITACAGSYDVTVIMTPQDCPTGTDRVCAAASQMTPRPDYVVNLQGDAPLTPPDFVRAVLDRLLLGNCDAVTPVTQLSWDELDMLRAAKQRTPHSGTLAVFDHSSGRAHWFSKAVLPVMRHETTLRQQSALSPVWRHIGLYGYGRAMLEKFVTLPEGVYEKLEGLEQLRILEHGYTMACVPVNYKGRPSMSGVDSPEDVVRAEALIAEHGDLYA